MENKKTVLITGASSGIGLLIASKLINSGYNVIGTSRKPEKYQKSLPFELLPLDVTSDASIANCMQLLMYQTQTLDVLINNAGGLLAGSVEETTMEQSYKQFETNFWGAVKMTKAVLPIMRKQRSGTIITTGSLLGLIGVPFNSYYSASKHAIEGFYKSLRLEVKPFNINVSVIEPGFFKTNIDQASEYATESISDYDLARTRVNKFFEDSLAKAPTAWPVADTVLKILHSKKPKFNYPVGSGTKLLPAIQFLSHDLFEAGFSKIAKL